MDFLQLVEKNRSYRGFDESAQVSRGQLERLVECARLCPSSVNMQPLKYYLSCDAETNARHPAAHWLGAQAAGKEPALSGAPAHGVHRDLPTIRCFAPNPERFYKDVGIVAQTMLLGAVDMGPGRHHDRQFRAGKGAAGAWPARNARARADPRAGQAR